MAWTWMAPLKSLPVPASTVYVVTIASLGPIRALPERHVLNELAAFRNLKMLRNAALDRSQPMVVYTTLSSSRTWRNHVDYSEANHRGSGRRRRCNPDRSAVCPIAGATAHHRCPGESHDQG